MHNNRKVLADSFTDYTFGYSMKGDTYRIQVLLTDVNGAELRWFVKTM